MAVLVPRLDVVISLVGAFSSSALALVFPPLVELLLLSSASSSASPSLSLHPSLSPSLPLSVLAKDLTIVLIGILGFLTGTYATLEEIIAPGDQTLYNDNATWTTPTPTGLPTATPTH